MQNNNLEIQQNVAVKYVFLDIIGYSLKPVECQADIIIELNKFVKKAVKKVIRQVNEIIYLPTGDGLCICLKDRTVPNDSHVKIALSILETLHHYNTKQATPKTRQFQLRIGINQHEDQEITDINGNTNFAGKGINITQRIMSLCDTNQILMGEAVYDILSEHEDYRDQIYGCTGFVKHGKELRVYQLRKPKLKYLNIKQPSRVFEKDHISEIMAYFIGFCIKYTGFIDGSQKQNYSNNAIIMLFILMAKNSVATDFSNISFENLLKMEDTLHSLNLLNNDILSENIGQFIKAVRNSSMSKYLNKSNPLEINNKAKRNLFNDYPKIVANLKLSVENDNFSMEKANG